METNMTTSKIKIKLGAIEVEYEGSETFLKEELPALLTAVSTLYQRANDDDKQGGSESGLNGSKPAAASNGGNVSGTTNNIAAKMNAKSGPELVLAAAARLCIVQHNDPFSRTLLIEEMRTATQYFKPSYVSNLSKTLNRLVKEGKLNEPSTDNFALTASSRKDLESRLAGS
jgi:hypothetical protein